MEDFRFSKFFGVSASMALLMGPSRLEEIINGVRSSIGGKMLNSLKLELESFRYFVTDDIEFSQTVDTTSEEYLYFVKGLKVFLNSKAQSEITDSSNDTVDRTSSSAGQTSAFSELSKFLPAPVYPDSMESVGTPENADELTEIDTSTAQEFEFGVETTVSTPNDVWDTEIRNDSSNTSGADPDFPSDSNSMSIFEGFDMISLDSVVPSIATNLIALGRSTEGDADCVVPLKNHPQVVMFFLRLSSTAESLGVSANEVALIMEQYQDLPVIYTGKIRFIRDNRTMDLQEDAYEVYHMLFTLHQMSCSQWEGKRLIDFIIDRLTEVVVNSSIETRKFLGTTFQALLSRHTTTVERTIVETLSADSLQGRIQRVTTYLDDCTELLAPRHSKGDRNALALAGINYAAGTKTESLETVLGKLREAYLSGSDGSTKLFPEFANPDENMKLTAFVKLCYITGQFFDIFSSLDTARHVYTVYKHIMQWNNRQWMDSLDLQMTSDPELAGTYLTIGVRKILRVPEGFNIDDYCEVFLRDYNIVGITTKSLVFFEDSLKLIGRIDTSEQYSVNPTNNSALHSTISCAQIHLKSLYHRLTVPIKSFWGD